MTRDRQDYEPPNCGQTTPHDQHFHSPIGNLTINCPGAAPPDVVAWDNITNGGLRIFSVALRLAPTGPKSEHIVFVHPDGRRSYFSPSGMNLTGNNHGVEAALSRRLDEYLTFAEQQTWNEAVRVFSCPFCGRAKGEPCQAILGDLYGPARDLIAPHENRLRLLTETDPAIRGSFS